MSTNADIDKSIKLLLEKLSEEFEIVKRQGFPSRGRNYYSQHSRHHDVRIPDTRWRAWAHELGMDYTRLDAILKVLVNEGLLEKYEFTSDYV